MLKKKNNKFMILWYSHPRIAIALSLVAINLAVIFIFATIISIVSTNPFFDELAYIFTFTMSSDGIYDFVNSQDDLTCFVLKMILAIIQMIIFSGALIGFTTNILQTTIDKRLNNLGKIKLNNHYIFLNWSSIGAHLIYDLSFLEDKKNIVILSEENRDEILNSIQNIFTENNRAMKNIRIFIKQGNPNSPKHLSDVSLESAKYVGILLADLENDNTHSMSNNDLNALKSLFSIMNVAKNANIVVEVENHDTVIKIEGLINTIDVKLNKRIIVFSHNSVLGHILGKAIVNPTFNKVYHNLLSYDGCEFYGIEPQDMEDALYKYNDCIPVINYDDDEELDEDGKLNKNQLYIISTNKEYLGIREGNKKIIKSLDYNYCPEEKDLSVFIFSRTGEAKYIIDELENFNKERGTNIQCYSYSYRDEYDEFIKKIKSCKGKKKILLLSSDDDSEVNQDEDIFLAALSFKLNNCIDENTEFLAEITNPSNLNSLKNFGIMSVIVSNRIISLFMVQLLTHPGSKKFYRDLISTNTENGNDEIDLDIKKVSEVLKLEEESIKFSCKSELVQSFYLASNKEKMCIGIKKKNENDVLFLCDRMDELEELVLNKDDELILINY